MKKTEVFALFAGILGLLADVLTLSNYFGGKATTMLELTSTFPFVSLGYAWLPVLERRQPRLTHAADHRQAQQDSYRFARVTVSLTAGVPAPPTPRRPLFWPTGRRLNPCLSRRSPGICTGLKAVWRVRRRSSRRRGFGQSRASRADVEEPHRTVESAVSTIMGQDRDNE